MIRRSNVEIPVPAVEPVRRIVDVTAFQRFWRCPLSYWFSRIAGYGEPASRDGMEFGSYVHRTLAAYFSNPPYSPSIHAFRHAAVRRARIADEAGVETANRAASFAEKVLSLIDLETCEIVSSEHRVEHRFGEFTLRGRADLLYHDNAKHKIVADFKTYKSQRLSMFGADVKFNFNSVDPFFALRCYDTLIAAEATNSISSTVLELLFLNNSARTRTGVSAETRERHYVELAERFEAMTRYVDTGVWMARVGPHCARCPFLSSCPGARGQGARW